MLLCVNGVCIAGLTNMSNDGCPANDDVHDKETGNSYSVTSWMIVVNKNSVSYASSFQTFLSFYTAYL